MVGKYLAAQEYAAHVDLHDRVELFGADVLRRRALGEAGIVHHDVDLAPQARHLIPRNEEMRLLPHVQRQGDRRLARRIERGCYRLRHSAVHIADGHATAPGMDFARHRLAHTTAAAGHQRSAACKGKTAIGRQREVIAHDIVLQ